MHFDIKSLSGDKFEMKQQARREMWTFTILSAGVSWLLDIFGQEDALDIQKIIKKIKHNLPVSHFIGWLYYHAGFLWGAKRAVRRGDVPFLNFLWRYSLLMYGPTEKRNYKKGCMMMDKILNDSEPNVLRILNDPKYRTWSDTGHCCARQELDMMEEKANREYKLGVRTPTESRLQRFSKMLNVTRANHRNVMKLTGKQSQEKKYIPDLQVTLEAIKKLLRDCFGTTPEDLKRASTYSELAKCNVTEDQVGWKHMLSKRTALKKYVKESTENNALYNPPPSQELESLHEEAARGGGELGGDSSSDSDDDALLLPTEEARSRYRSKKHNYWLQKYKPLPGETEDEFSARVMAICERGMPDAQARTRGQQPKKQSDAAPALNFELGKDARLFYEKETGKKERKPTKIKAHRPSGPRLGRQYLFVWREVGYGPDKEVWKGGDFALKYKDLLDNYNKDLEIAQREDLYEVEKVIDMRKGKKHDENEYLVVWKGWKGQDTWEPLSHLKDEGAQEALNSYMATVAAVAPKKKKRKISRK